MLTSTQEKILRSMFQAMKPIARFLLYAGISFREFSDTAKAAFVQVATDEYGIRGRPTNVSRVAVMTGLTRKEVKRLRDATASSEDAYLSKSNPLSEVLHYWNTDPSFCDVNGDPRVLNTDGGGDSFSDLVRRCAGDIPPGAMKSELKRVGAIIETDDGRLKVTTRQHLPTDADERLLVGIGFGLRTLATTIAVNGNPDSASTWPQKFVDSALIDPKLMPELSAYLSKKIMEFSIETDNYLSEVEEDSREVDAKDLQTVGVGVYFFSEQSDR
jgi:hypothetical protein